MLRHSMLRHGWNDANDGGAVNVIDLILILQNRGDCEVLQKAQPEPTTPQHLRMYGGVVFRIPR